ncbi:MAG: hypothetical protein HKN44_05900 [Ilumatobacter sp.]|nr:hypothetical protein [Ilumatobacter sp.]
MLVVLGIIMIVLGAIVTFAIDTAVEGVDLEAIGYIIMAGGVVALAAAAIRGAGWMTMNNRRMHSERHVSSDGNHVVEETQVS